MLGYLKHQVKRSATDFIAGSTIRDLSNGVPINEIKLPTDLPGPRNASTASLLDAYMFFTDNRDVVKNAWGRSRVGELALSWESLFSAEALGNLVSLRQSDPVFDMEFGKFGPATSLKASVMPRKLSRSLTLNSIRMTSL